MEWLGQVPSHWTVKRLSWVFAEIGSGTTPPDDQNGYFEGDINWVTTGELRERAISSTTKHVTAAALRAFSTLRLYPPGTLLIAMYGATIGRLGWLSTPACTNQACCALSKPIEADQRFVFYSLQAALPALLNLSSGGGQPNINQEKLRAFRIATPPLSEQVAIAAFLDSEAVKFDALVEEQRRLIDLLKEKRQAVISHAVTKGLDPSVPMKDTGAEWLGEVPAHWESLTIRRIAKSVQTGNTPSSEPASADFVGGVSWYTPGDFEDKLLLAPALKRLSALCLEKGEARMFPRGVALVVSIGATLGKVGYALEPCSANQQINAICPNETVDGWFLTYALSARSEIMKVLSNASTIGIMNQERTKEIPLARPPLPEQQKISEFLDVVIAKVDALTAEAETAIGLLKERRSALISAAVTGKIDVRGLVPVDAAAA
jgi:type I restriction enzyme S subunit